MFFDSQCICPWESVAGLRESGSWQANWRSRLCILNQLMPSQHLYNGLASTADYCIFHGNGLICLRMSPCWHRNELARTDNVLAYGHQGWHMASMASQCWNETDRHQDGHHDNGTTLKHNVPVAGYVQPVEHKHFCRWWLQWQQTQLMPDMAKKFN